jgi:predicted nucleic acid-binding protein
MSATLFVDSNVLVYAVDRRDAEKQRAARAWREALWRTRCGRLSFQVLQEFYVQSCRLNPEATEQARAEVRDLLAWEPVVCDAAVLQAAFDVQHSHRISFWDALIVAAAQACAASHLLTEGLQHGQVFETVEVVNPFLIGPEQLLGAALDQDGQGTQP